jgi:zinc/manganese transport system permease protein
MPDTVVGPSWNIVTDIQELWSFPFMVNAFRAGTLIAIAAAVMGWFMVLRRQTFAGHTLAVVGFPGAAGATLIGIGAIYGYYAFCLVAATVIAAVSRDTRGAHSSAVTATVQAFALACGFLFITVYKGFLGAVNSLLFGAFLGITDDQVVAVGIGTVAVLGILLVLGRPLLFATIDPDVAAARGVPVRHLSIAFLILLGAAVAETSQITGTLLVFALLVMPAATAATLTTRPAHGLVTAAAIGVAVTWLGLGAAYYTDYPIGFFVTTIAFCLYVLAQLAQRGRSLLRGRASGSAS